MLLLGGASAQAATTTCDGVTPVTPTVVNADVTANTTWSGTVVLAKTVFVKNGAILTILPGTVVRAPPRQAPDPPGGAAGDPGSLIVTQNGRIIADATASNPIILTTAAVDNNNDGIADDVDLNVGFKDPWVSTADTFLDDTCTTAPLAPLDKAGRGNVQLWGGLVILGSAPTNHADKVLGGGASYGLATIEGLTVPGHPVPDVQYGGVLPHDNSGILRFVSIRHAGDEIGASNELNGLSLGGVGDGTVISFVEIYTNFDDAFEWFGGTVGTDHLFAAFVGDDMFDMDEGYTGVNQFLFGIAPFFKQNDGLAYGSASGDKIGEFDGDNYRPDNTAFNNDVNVRVNQQGTTFDPTPWPLSSFENYNITGIGSTPDGTQDFAPAFLAGTKRGLQFRNGAAGNVYNSVITNTGGETGVEIDQGATGAPGFDAITNTNNGLVNVVCLTTTDGLAADADPAGEATAYSNGNTLATLLGAGASSINQVNPALAGDVLVNDDTTFDPTGDASGKLAASLKTAKIDPRLAAGLPINVRAGCPAPRGRGLNATATYRGAFAPGAPLWTNGWTALNEAGLLAN
jgi:hypothetical protein